MADLHPDTAALLELTRELVERVQRRDFNILATEFPEADELREVVEGIEDPRQVILDLLVVVDNLEKRLINVSLHCLEGGS